MASSNQRVEIRDKPPTVDPDTLLGELILYIATQCEQDPAFGAVKLNKLLWRADFAAYAELGSPITGQEYFALEHGPAPRRLLPVLERLKEEGAAAVKQGDYHGRPQQRTFALRDANLDLFSGQTVALIDRIIRECRDQNATELSEASHGFLGWKVARREETIPYCVALVEARPLSKTEQQFARDLAGVLEVLVGD